MSSSKTWKEASHPLGSKSIVTAMRDPKGTSEQEKPRHLEEETAKYLLQIEAQLKDIGQNDQETKEILVSNVLTEIQSRSASAACDRRTNFLFEQLCYHASSAQLIMLLQKWTPYSIFLARNRYASHIVQTVISRICYFYQQSTIYDEIDESVVEQTILLFSRSLLQELYWLSKEMSASHVIRSLLCLLSGLPTIAEKKGKNSKHQHAVVFSEPLDTMIAPNAFYISHERAFLVPASFHGQLSILSSVHWLLISDPYLDSVKIKEEVLNGFKLLLSKSKHDLQLFIAEISSCAVLTLLLKIIANPHLFAPDGTNLLFREFLEKLFDAAIIQPSSISSEACDVFYAMAGDKLGSYFLETMITVFPFEEMILPIIEKNMLGVRKEKGNVPEKKHKPTKTSKSEAEDDDVSLLKEYCFDHFGNYVFQAVLKRLHIEYLFLKTVESHSEQLNRVQEIFGWVLEEITKVKDALPEKDFLQLLQGKSGVFYWLLELCESFDREADFLTIASWVVLGWKEEVAPSSDVTISLNPSNTALIAEVAHYLEKKFTEKPSAGVDASGSATTPHEESVTGNIAGLLLLSKFIRSLLRSSSEQLSNFIFQSVMSLSVNSFNIIINTSQINKNIIDTILLAPNAATSATQSAKYNQFKLLSIKMTDPIFFPIFAKSFYGVKNIKTAYEHCDIRGREKWMLLLQDARPQLQKSKDGKQLIEFCHLDLYLRDAKEWKLAEKKELKDQFQSGKATSDILVKSNQFSSATGKEIETNKRKHGEITATQGPNNKNNNDNSAIDKEVGEKKKRKRKRQRKSKPGEEASSSQQPEGRESDEDDG